MEECLESKHESYCSLEIYVHKNANCTTSEICSFCFVVTTYDMIQQHFARFDETFFQFCDKELLKINTFFSGNLDLSCQ